MIARLAPDNVEHLASANCDCPMCEKDRREVGCVNPHRCACAAEALLGRLRPKWNPFQTFHADGLTLTQTRKRANDTARAEKGRVVFDPSVTQTGPLAAVFRVFTHGSGVEESVAARPPRPFEVVGEEVEVYTDGSCIGNGTAAAAAGSGAWFGHEDERNEGARVPYDAQSNQTGEVYAILLAERQVPPFVPLHLVSDSKYVVDGLTTHLAKWEERGWIGVANSVPFREAAAALRARSAVTTLRWVKGHSRVRGNEAADALAKVGAGKLPPFRPVLLPKLKFLRDGAALTRLTQSLAYKGVKLSTLRDPRKATARNMELVVAAVKSECGVALMERSVWLALRKDPVSRKIRDFLWKAIHGAHRVGKYWLHIPGYEMRGMCAVCNQTDDMTHILTRCGAAGQREVWELARTLLSVKLERVPVISTGLALGSHVFTVLDGEGAVVGDKTRFARIVLTEAAHLIWALRCERVIGWEDAPERRHTKGEIRGRFEARLNTRLALDQGGTCARVHKKRALSGDKVLATWRGALRDEQALPDDWLAITEVLVGIPPYPMRDTG